MPLQHDRLRDVALLVLLMPSVPIGLVGQARVIHDLRAPAEARLSEGFSGISGVRPLPDGRLVVVDGVERRVDLVDLARDRRTRIGREGEGPGEYRRPGPPVATLAGGTLVGDASLSRIIEIDSTGTVRGTRAMPTGEGQSRLTLVGSDTSGRLFLRGTFAFYAGEEGPTSPTAPILRHDPRTGRTEEMGRMEMFADGTTITNPMDVAAPRPFAPRDTWVGLPDGRVAIVRNMPYRLDIISETKRVVSGPAATHVPVPVGPADRDAWRAAYRPATITMHGADGGQGSRQGPGATNVPDEVFPKVKPPFTRALVDPDGRIWVERSRAAADTVPRYDLFDGSGRHLGQALLPKDRMVVGFGTGSVFLAHVDDTDDLRYLERHRLPER